MPYYIKKKTNKNTSKSRVKTLEKKLDKIFSLYIRLRDSKNFQFKYFRCISCNKLKTFEDADCGHYFSRKNKSTRFSEINCNAECSYCNRFKADHLHGYRDNLVKKIGQERFDLLQWESNQAKKYSEFELEALIEYYTCKVKELKCE